MLEKHPVPKKRKEEACYRLETGPGGNFSSFPAMGRAFRPAGGCRTKPSPPTATSPHETSMGKHLPQAAGCVRDKSPSSPNAFGGAHRMPRSPGAGATSCPWAVSFFMGETHIAPASVQAPSQHPRIILHPPRSFPTPTSAKPGYLLCGLLCSPLPPPTQCHPRGCEGVNAPTEVSPPASIPSKIKSGAGGGSEWVPQVREGGCLACGGWDYFPALL